MEGEGAAKRAGGKAEHDTAQVKACAVVLLRSASVWHLKSRSNTSLLCLVAVCKRMPCKRLCHAQGLQGTLVV